MMLLAALLAGAATALLLPAGATSPSPPRPAATVRRRLAVVVAACVFAVVLLADGAQLVLALLLLATLVGAGRLVGAVRRRRAAEQVRRRVVELAQGLAGELRAGQPPQQALARVAEGWPPLAAVDQAARLGADVPAALRRLADRPGAESLRDVAAAWQVAEASGSGLTLALSRVADAAREREAADRIVAAELASAQATARLVAALPVLVLVLGSGLGGDPWTFLLTAPVGLVCLGAGLLLMLGGLSWIERIAAEVTR